MMHSDLATRRSYTVCAHQITTLPQFMNSFSSECGRNWGLTTHAILGGRPSVVGYARMTEPLNARL